MDALEFEAGERGGGRDGHAVFLFLVLHPPARLTPPPLGQSEKVSILFPGVIGLLMFARGIVLPRFFSDGDLAALGDEVKAS